MIKKSPVLLGLSLIISMLPAKAAAPAWSPDLGDGTYKNPIIHADYSDPDAIRVGEDYWLTSSDLDLQSVHETAPLRRR